MTSHSLAAGIAEVCFECTAGACEPIGGIESARLARLSQKFLRAPFDVADVKGELHTSFDCSGEDLLLDRLGASDAQRKALKGARLTLEGTDQEPDGSLEVIKLESKPRSFELFADFPDSPSGDRSSILKFIVEDGESFPEDGEGHEYGSIFIVSDQYGEVQVSDGSPEQRDLEIIAEFFIPDPDDDTEESLL